jgi:hypothetical protein
MISCDLQAVVVSGDASVSTMLPAWLKAMGVRPILCDNTTAAIEAVSRQRVDALFVDSDLDPDFSALRKIRATAAGRKLIAMAIVSREVSVREAFRVSDFILEKPLVQQRVMQTLRAAHGLMVRDRMQYTRVPLQTEALLFDAGANSTPAVAINVSQSGIALSVRAQLTAGQVVNIHFRLPQAPKTLGCKAKVIWTDRCGQSGFAFVDMKATDREILSSWIESQFMETWQQKVLPGNASFIPAAAPAAAMLRA